MLEMTWGLLKPKKGKKGPADDASYDTKAIISIINF